jgi:putative cell wall-binding protein
VHGRKDLIARVAPVAVACLTLAGCSLGDDSSSPPQLGAKSSDKKASVKLGFPSTATRNTIRVGGGDPASDAAGVASALFPATTDASRPTAVILVRDDDWQSAITAASLSGSPIGAPILITNGSSVPPVTQDTLKQLKPKGSDLSKGAQVIRIGRDTGRPSGFRSAVIEGKDPYERAAAIDRFFSAVRGKPSANVVIVSGEHPEWAVPAAAWAARAGDSVLPVKRDSVPAAIQKALQQHQKPNVYVLGPKKVIGNGVLKQLQPLAGRVARIQGKTPVDNAIAFARYQRGNFGWAVVVPGYNFTLANTGRPLDAAAAASLATKGVFAPLVLTDKSGSLPGSLRTYFLSVQPGYEGSPDTAVYNRVWILGDDKAISVKQQAQVDRITELVPVQGNAP